MKNKDRCQGKFWTEIMGFTDGLCANKAALPHVCPFNSEINDDKTECECCEECEANCAEEI